jgi:hypothetical protein
LIAYVGGDPAAQPGTQPNKVLWLMSSDGTERGPLAVIPDAADGETILTGIDNPQWSPDGSTIVADLLYSCPYGANCSHTVGVINPVTGQSRALTCVHDVPNGIGMGDPKRCATSEVGGTFSPDGTKIAYLDLHALDGAQIYLLDYATCTSNYQRAETCAKAPLTPASAEIAYGALSWSPDGRWIAAQQFNTGGSRSDIVAVNVVTGAAVNLTADLTSEGLASFRSPDWSPDGDHLVAQGGSGAFGDQGLSVLDVTCGASTCGRTAAQVLASTSRVFDPTYSPDGTKVAFTLNQVSGADEVWAINIDGTGAARLTAEATGEVETTAANPGWQPVPRVVAAPMVLSTSPIADATDVATTSSVVATFDQSLTEFTLILSTTTKRPAQIAGTVFCTANCTTITFDPSATLKRKKTYRAIVTGANANGTATLTWLFRIR